VSLSARGWSFLERQAVFMAYGGNDYDDSKKYSNRDKGRLFAWGGYILITLCVIIAVVLVWMFG